MISQFECVHSQRHQSQKRTDQTGIINSFTRNFAKHTTNRLINSQARTAHDTRNTIGMESQTAESSQASSAMMKKTKASKKKKNARKLAEATAARIVPMNGESSGTANDCNTSTRGEGKWFRK